MHYITLILKFIQTDIRRLISVLYDLKSTFEDDEIDVEKFKLFKENSFKKCKDTSLFDASKDLINHYNDVNSSLSHYKVDKVLVPLTIHENFYKSLFSKVKENKYLMDDLFDDTKIKEESVPYKKTRIGKKLAVL